MNDDDVVIDAPIMALTIAIAVIFSLGVLVGKFLL